MSSLPCTYFIIAHSLEYHLAGVCSGGSKEGRRGRAPPLGVQILSISCSFWEILAKSYVAPPGELAPPPRGNPGSATGVLISTASTIRLGTVSRRGNDNQIGNEW